MPANPPVFIVAYEYQFVPYATIAHWQESYAQVLEELQARQPGGSSWFTLERKGIRLAEYVGVVQVQGLTLEILPKADDPDRTGNVAVNEQQLQQDRWRKILLGMLRQVMDLPLAVPSSANLATATHKMLDVFLAAYVEQSETVFRMGLVKHYHAAEGNRSALKGQLLFSQHLTQNLLHRERFFTRHQVYDRAHPLNCLLRMALQIAADLAHSALLAARARTLLLHWPELPVVPVPAERPVLGRKTEYYSAALDLALLVLRAHSPNLQRGANQALALLFDMNSLFEEYVEKVLRRAARQNDCLVHAQQEKPFWSTIKARPDVAVTIMPTANDTRPARICILDMKWKVPKRGKPSPEDMRQIYTYCHLWGARHGLLVYPWVGVVQHSRHSSYASSKWSVDGVVISGHTHYVEVLLPSGILNSNLGEQTLKMLRNLSTD